MDMLKRAFGIAGHNSERARIICAAANDLTRESRALNVQLKQYTSAADPLKALMIDLHNRNVEARLARGE